MIKFHRLVERGCCCVIYSRRIPPYEKRKDVDLRRHSRPAVLSRAALDGSVPILV